MSRYRGYRLTEMATPAVVWALHFVIVYSMAGLACGQGWQRGRTAGLEAVTWLMVATTVLSWLVLAFIAWRAWRGRTTAQPARDEAGAGATDASQARKRFLSTVTLAMAAIAALAVSFTVIPVFLLPTCAG